MKGHERGSIFPLELRQKIRTQLAYQKKERGRNIPGKKSRLCEVPKFERNRVHESI